MRQQRRKCIETLNHAIQPVTQAVIDTLETRRLLSAAINSSGVLVITGTSAADIITLTFAANRVQVRDNGVLTKFIYTSVKSISIGTLAGNDSITLPINLPTSISGTLIDVSDGNDTVIGSNLNDVISGGKGNDSLSGMAANDQLFGNDGNDFLNGGDGDLDRIYPGAGNDTCDGGAGTYDTLTYQGTTYGVTCRIDGGNSGATAGGETDTAVNFENAVGGLGNDVVIGNAGPNVVGGDAGDDILDGGLGKDSIYGDAGVDTVTYASRAVPVVVNLSTGTGGQANEGDLIFTTENVVGGSSNDNITGDDLANNLRGGSGNDHIDGRIGNDYIVGDAGRDYLIGGTGINRIRGGAHNDTVIGGNSRDNIAGDDGDDSILSGGGDDYIDGGAGNDYIDAGLGTDTAVHDVHDLTVLRVETLV